jgi:hypothetical protein
MRWVAVPAPGRTLPSARAACSSARTTVVPMAITRPPRSRHASINRAVDAGMQYGSSSGNSRSSSASPVEEMPAAWVSVANAAPRARSKPIRAQSRMNPADGASKATGWPAIRVQVSQIASGSGTYAYWIGRPCRARPSQISATGFSKRISISRGCPGTASTIARSGPSCSLSPGCKAGGGGRCSVGVRKSPAPNTTAVNRVTSRGLNESRPASRTSTAPPVGR